MPGAAAQPEGVSSASRTESVSRRRCADSECQIEALRACKAIPHVFNPLSRGEGAYPPLRAGRA